MKKERIENFDFIRGVAALLIIGYHIICLFESVPSWNFFPIKSHTINGDWGHSAVVSMFFMLSGATLLYNYPTLEKKALKTFYIKRWKSIFPAFYLVWGYLYLNDVIKTGNFFYAASPKYLLLSLFGMDGYFNYAHTNFYSVGEWFLGAIIILYLIYPLVLYCYNHFFKLSTFLLFLAFCLNMKLDLFQISDADNLITCLFCFWMGMIFVRYFNRIKTPAIPAFLSLGICLFFLFFPLNTNQYISMIIAGIALFLVLFYAAPYVFKVLPLKKLVRTSSDLSYELFLVHHIFMNYVFNCLAINPDLHISVPFEIGRASCRERV